MRFRKTASDRKHYWEMAMVFISVVFLFFVGCSNGGDGDGDTDNGDDNNDQTAVIDNSRFYGIYYAVWDVMSLGDVVDTIEAEIEIGNDETKAENRGYLYFPETAESPFTFTGTTNDGGHLTKTISVQGNQFDWLAVIENDEGEPNYEFSSTIIFNDTYLRGSHTGYQWYGNERDEYGFDGKIYNGIWAKQMEDATQADISIVANALEYNAIDDSYASYSMFSLDGSIPDPNGIETIHVTDGNDDELISNWSGVARVNQLIQPWNASSSALGTPFLSLFYIHLNGFGVLDPDLTEGDYTFDISLSEGGSLSETIDFPGPVAQPEIAVESIGAEWVDGELVFSWTPPTDSDPAYGNYDQIQVYIEDHATGDGTDWDAIYIAQLPKDADELVITSDVLESIQKMHRPSRLAFGLRLVAFNDQGFSCVVSNFANLYSLHWKHGVNGTAGGTWSYNSSQGILTLDTTTTTFDGCGPRAGGDAIPIIIDEEALSDRGVVVMTFNPETDHAMNFGGSLSAYIDSGRELYGTGWATIPRGDRFHNTYSAIFNSDGTFDVEGVIIFCED